MKRLFEIKSLKSVPIKSVFELIKQHIKETSIIINKHGIKITSKDEHACSFTEVKLFEKKFEKFTCYCDTCNTINSNEDKKGWHCDQEYILGMNITLFFKIIKNVNRKDIISFFMNQEDEDYLYIERTNPFIGRVKSNRVPILLLQSENSNFIDIDFDYIITFPTAQFQETIKDINILDGKVIEITSYGKHLVFKCNDDKIAAHYESTYTDIEDDNMEGAKMIVQNEDNRNIIFLKTSNNIVQGKFKIDHLLSFCKGHNLCDSMSINLSNDSPLILNYSIADLGELQYALLPI